MYQNYSYDEWVEWIARLPEKGAKGFTQKLWIRIRESPQHGSPQHG